MRVKIIKALINISILAVRTKDDKDGWVHYKMVRLMPIVWVAKLIYSTFGKAKPDLV